MGLSRAANLERLRKATHTSEKIKTFDGDDLGPWSTYFNIHICTWNWKFIAERENGNFNGTQSRVQFLARSEPPLSPKTPVIGHVLVPERLIECETHDRHLPCSKRDWGMQICPKLTLTWRDENCSGLVELLAALHWYVKELISTCFENTLESLQFTKRF